MGLVSYKKSSIHCMKVSDCKTTVTTHMFNNYEEIYDISPKIQSIAWHSCQYVHCRVHLPHYR